MKRTLLRWHLGLGDALICNGLVRVLVERGRKLMLPCYPRNEASVRAMFSDLGDAVEIMLTASDNYQNPGSDEIRLGYFGEDFDPQRFDESFHRQSGVPFLAKWTKFKLPDSRHIPRTGKDTRQIHRVIHDDALRGFSIPLKGFRPDATIVKSLFDYVIAINCAEELHCINSCFAILADLIHAPGKKYLHHYARPTDLPVFGDEWTILKESING